MFVHSHTVRMRVLAIALLIPTFYLGWIALLAMAKMPLVGILVLAIAALMLWACWEFWKHAAHSDDKKPLPDPSNWKGPNVIGRKTRTINIVISSILLVYGVYSLVIDDFFLPAKGGGGTHFTGIGAWLMFGAISCIAVKLVAEVIDHYDRRNNELAYAHVLAVSDWFAWTFFAAALFHIWVA